MESNTFSKQDIDAGKGMSVLSYLGVLALIPYFAEKKNKYVRFHAVQGINLLILGVILGVIYGIVSSIMTASAITSYSTYSYGYGSAAVAGLGIVGLIFWIIFILFGVIEIIGIVYAATGKTKPVPILGKIRIVKK